MKKTSIAIIYIIFLLHITFLNITGLKADSETYPKKSTVIIDPFDKLNIRGNVYIAYAWGEQLRFPLRFTRGLFNLKNAVIKWTQLNIGFDDHLMLSSERLLEMPFVYVTTDDLFELTETERKNVKKYFANGGFMVLENSTPRSDFSMAEASLKQMLRETIPNARFSMIHNNHPLYHCFFDFSDGPPNGAEIGRFGNYLSQQRYYLEGVWLKDRLVAIYSNKGYIIKWSNNTDNDPQLKMGVNMIVFALIQDGGISNKE